MFAFRVNSSLYNTNNGPLLNTLSGRGVLLWWRFYLCSQINHTWKIDNLKRLNSKFWEFIYIDLVYRCGRSIEINTHRWTLDAFIYWLLFHYWLFFFLCTYGRSFVRSLYFITLKMTSHYNHHTRNAHTRARTHTMKLSTINYSQHDYSNCIFWRVLYSIYIPLMLFTYYLFALLCNLVWILDTLTLSVLYIS